MHLYLFIGFIKNICIKKGYSRTMNLFYRLWGAPQELEEMMWWVNLSGWNLISCQMKIWKQCERVCLKYWELSPMSAARLRFKEHIASFSSFSSCHCHCFLEQKKNMYTNCTLHDQYQAADTVCTIQHSGQVQSQIFAWTSQR